MPDLERIAFIYTAEKINAYIKSFPIL